MTNNNMCNWINAQYNSTGLCRPPDSGCSTARTCPASAPSYISVCSPEARHGSRCTGHRSPCEEDYHDNSGDVTSLTWFCHHRSSGSPGTGCTGYTTQGRSDIGGTWSKHLLGLKFFLASRALTKLTDTRARTLWHSVWSL